MVNYTQTEYVYQLRSTWPMAKTLFDIAKLPLPHIMNAYALHRWSYPDESIGSLELDNRTREQLIALAQTGSFTFKVVY